MDNKISRLVIGYNGIIDDKQIDIMELLIRDITDDFVYDDCNGSTFYIETMGMKRALFNQLVVIGKNFKSFINTQISDDNGMTHFTPIYSPIK